MVIKVYPVFKRSADVLDALETLPVRALLFKDTNDAFDHFALLWTMGRDEVLALPAAEALPLRERWQPSNSRVWQSMTMASVAQPSRPDQMRRRSVDHSSLGAAATEGGA